MAAKMLGTDKRAFPRVDVARSVEIVLVERGVAETLSATLADISQNGALVITNTPIPMGEWVMIRPDRKGAGFGVEITAIVDRNLTPGAAEAKLICRFPQPIEYSVLRMYM